MDSPDRRLHLYSVVGFKGVLELIGSATSLPEVISLILSQAPRDVSQSVVIDLQAKKALLVPFNQEALVIDVSLLVFLDKIIPGWQRVQLLNELF